MTTRGDKISEGKSKDRFRRDLGKVEETYAKVADLVAGALPL